MLCKCVMQVLKIKSNLLLGLLCNRLGLNGLCKCLAQQFVSLYI